MLQNLLQKIQIFLAKNKQLIVSLFRVLHYFLISLFFAGIVVLIYGDTAMKAGLVKIGKDFGTISFLFYATTLIPGILGRFRIFNTLKAILTLFRRQIGVSAFLTAFVHEGYVYTLPVLLGGGNIFKLATSHVVYGFVAMLILFPMWLTSNNFSERKLGRYWKMLHRITYAALIFIFLHIATSSSDKLPYVAFTMIIFELVSWIYFFLTSKKSVTPPQNIQSVTETSTTL